MVGSCKLLAPHLPGTYRRCRIASHHGLETLLFALYQVHIRLAVFCFLDTAVALFVRQDQVLADG